MVLKLFKFIIILCLLSLSANTTYAADRKLVRKAKLLQKKKKFLSAYKTYKKIIAKNKKYTSKLIKRYKKSGPENLPQVRLKIYSYFHGASLAIVSHVLRAGDRISGDVAKSLIYEAKMYAEICSESDNYDNDQIDLILDKIKKYEQEHLQSEYYSNYYLNFGYATWADQLTITSSSAEVHSLQATTAGYLVGIGYKLQNQQYLWKIDANAIWAGATVGNTTTEITYFQKDIPVFGMLVSPSFLYKPSSKEVAFGINIPIIYRIAEYTEPANTTIAPKSIFTYGFFLEGEWIYHPLTYALKFGTFESSIKNLWALEIHYNF